MAELSGIDIIPLVKETSEKLRGTYVNNVFSVGAAQIVRFRHPGDTDSWLLVSPRHGCWVSSRLAARSETTEFTSRLRGEVERLKFSSSNQVDLDRVFDIVLSNGESKRHLILELMPPGNIVVTDEEGRIRLILNEVRSAKRQLRRGVKYSPPPQTRATPNALTSESLRVILEGEKTMGNALGRRIALPRKYVRETLGRLGLNESDQATDGLGMAERIAATIRNIVEEAKSPSPCLALTEDGEELYAIIPRSAKVSKRASTMTELCDELFVDSILREAGEGPTLADKWRKESEVTIVRLRRQEQESMESARRLREAAQKAGEATSLAKALEILEAAGGIGHGKAPPRSRESVASALFAKAKEAETRAGEARRAAESLSLRKPPKRTAGPRTTRELNRRKKEWYEKFRWFFSSRGKLAVGGRDAQSNSLLVRRHLDSDDVVYHADLIGSPFFVLKGGLEQTDDEILETAQATVAFSSAWKTGLGSADAYWVTREQVGAAAPSGEFLAKGSFMIRGKRNYVQRNAVQVALGADASGRVVAGPERAVAAASRSYVVLVPHREKASETAKKVVHELKRMDRDGRGPSLDDVLRALPAGGGKIVRTKGPRAEDKP